MIVFEFEGINMDHDRKQWEVRTDEIARNYGTFFEIPTMGIDSKTMRSILQFESGQMVDIAATAALKEMIDDRKIHELRTIKRRIETYRDQTNDETCGRAIEEAIKYVEKVLKPNIMDQSDVPASMQWLGSSSSSSIRQEVVDGWTVDHWIDYAKDQQAMIEQLMLAIERVRQTRGAADTAREESQYVEA